ncbi:MAG: tetratricopeptide repeat protein [Armatimonadota bacterium]|nr:MAG: tetratricopeptide repeat protein [Armatimonadota bacterium]
MICPVCNAEFDGDKCPECGASVTSATSALVSAASALLKEGLPDQAIESLDRAIERDPKSYEAHSLLGAAYMRKQEYELAGHHFERAVWLDSGRTGARYNLAVAYRAAGRTDEALKQVRAALEKDPNHEKSKALLRELRKDSAGEGREGEAGAPENRPRAAAPHLHAVHVPGQRLSHRVQVGLGALSATVALVLGAFAYVWIFRLLTSPQLIGRDAALWGQLPYAFGVIIFVAGVIAASFQAKGFPLAGALAGLVGAPGGVALVLVSEGESVTATILLGAAACGAAGVAVFEAFSKFTRVGEYRRTLLWVSIALVAAYVIVGHVRQGSLRGYVTITVPDALGQPVILRVPDAELTLADARGHRSYVTYSVNARESKRPAAANGSYRLRGMPVGHYTLSGVDPDSGALWQGDVWVDYAIVGGDEKEIPLLMPLEKVEHNPRLRF